MKIRFIINPTAGTGKHKGIDNYIAKYLQNYEIFYTKKAGEATEISRDAVRKKIDAVVAVGGDGTVNECLRSLINTNTALGIIPCGSGNGFAYHIGMERNTEKAIRQLKNVKTKYIDSCSVNGIPFVNVSGIGFDAHVAKLFSNLQNRGFSNYIKIILQEISYTPHKYSLKYDGSERKITAFMIAFANASQYGNDTYISPMADIKDGLLDFVIIKEFPRWHIPFFLIQIALGKIHLSKYVEIVKSKKMEIRSQKNTLIHLDGEPYTTTNPIRISLLEKSLKILQPYEKK